MSHGPILFYCGDSHNLYIHTHTHTWRVMNHLISRGSCKWGRRWLKAGPHLDKVLLLPKYCTRSLPHCPSNIHVDKATCLRIYLLSSTLSLRPSLKQASTSYTIRLHYVWFVSFVFSNFYRYAVLGGLWWTIARNWTSASLVGFFFSGGGGIGGAWPHG